MYRKIKLLSLMLLCSMTKFSYAQNGGAPDQNVMPNQGTASGINSIYSTNYFDGTVNLAIPFYDYSAGNNSFGVAISYNTRGILVDEVATNTGLHWNLISGPSIERLVKDIPDEINYEFPSYDGDSLYFGAGDVGIYNPHRYVKGKYAVYGETTIEAARTNVYRDGELDDFVLSFGNSTVTFNLGKDLNNFTHPHRDIKIQPFLNGVPINKITTQLNGSGSNTLEFQVTDEQGNKYYFVNGEYETQKFYDNTYWDGDLDQLVEARQINRWVIKKVTLIDGNEINYTYDTYPASSTYTKYDNYTVKETSTGTVSYMGVYSPTFNGAMAQLSRIDYPNATSVNIIYHATNKTEADQPLISEIKVSGGSNCIRYLLYYSLSNARLILNSIEKKGCGMTTSDPYYSFEYVSDPVLPARLNSGRDLYGYYNGDSVGVAIGGSGTGITTPAHNWSTGLPNYGLSRFPVPWKATASLLNKVTNEFGGTATFYYSGNEALSVLTGLPTGENYLGAADRYGVKVDSIVEADHYEYNSYLKKIKITYSNGQIFTPGGYFHYPVYINYSTNVWEQVNYQSMFLTHHDLINGSNHGYSNVSIKILNGQNQQLSRKDISFTNINDPTASAPRYYRVSGSKQFYEYPYTAKQYLKDWEIGLPLEVTEYDFNDRITSKIINQYQFSAVDLSGATSFTSQKKIKVSTGSLTTPPLSTSMPSYYATKKIFTDTYYPYTGHADLIRTVHNKYVSDTRSVSDTLWFTYDLKQNKSSIKTKNSIGEITTTRFVYNYDVDGPANPYTSTYPGTAIYKMTQDSIQALVGVEYWDEENSGTKPYSNTLLNARITGFKYDNGKLWIKSQHDLATELPIGYTDYTGMSMGSPILHRYQKIIDATNTSSLVPYFQKSSDVTVYDSKGNANELQYLGKNKFTSAIWDTTNGNKLAEATCRYTDVGYSSFEDLYGLTGGWAYRGNLDINTGKVLDVSASSTLNSVTGKFIYQLTPAPGTGFDFSDINGVNNLTVGKEYILSLWSRGGVPKVYIGTTLLTTPSISYTKGSWNQYIYRFTPTVAAKIKISPLTSTIYLDEVRLHPSSAVMETATYEALFGISSKTDPTGRITYTEFDKLGRPIIIRDQEGSILKKMKYNTIGGFLY